MTSERLESLQILRFVAAFSVVLFHYFFQLKNNYGFDANYFRIGTAGVDIFFVISGFIISYTVRHDRRPLAFFLRRVFRVVPLYWALTLGVFAIALIRPDLLSVTQADLTHLIKSFLFIPCLCSDGEVAPMLFLGWTLNYEFFFYSLFAIALALFKKPHVAMCILITLLVAAGSIIQPDSVILRFYTNGVLMEFVYGIVIFLIYDKRPAFIHKTRHVWILGALALLVQNFYPVQADVGREVVWGIPAALFVYGILVSTIPRTPITTGTVLLGDASYSMYLVHPYIFQGLLLLIMPLFGAANTSFLVFGITGAAVTFAASLVLYFAFERTTNEFLRQKFLG
jgi:exopolysaccharide production protein ExoZ